jgi:hypothetical protein
MIDKNMIKKDDPRLTAFVLGELGERESKLVQAAIDESDELKLAVDEIRRTTELLVVQFAEEPVSALAPQQRQAILDSGYGGKVVDVGDFSKAPKVDSRRANRQWVGWLVAAGVAFVLGSILYATIDWSGDDPVAIGPDPDPVVAKVEPDDEDVSLFFREQKIAPTHESGKQATETWEAYVNRLARLNYITPQQKADWEAGQPLVVERVLPTTRYRQEARARSVPVTVMRTEQRTRVVTVAREREETRKRMVPGEDGKLKEEEYTVKVPYTEQVEQNYTVQVPHTEQRTQNYTVQVPYTEQVPQRFELPARGTQPDDTLLLAFHDPSPSFEVDPDGSLVGNFTLNGQAVYGGGIVSGGVAGGQHPAPMPMRSSDGVAFEKDSPVDELAAIQLNGRIFPGGHQFAEFENQPSPGYSLPSESLDRGGESGESKTVNRDSDDLLVDMLGLELESGTKDIQIQQQGEGKVVLLVDGKQFDVPVTKWYFEALKDSSGESGGSKLSLSEFKKILGEKLTDGEGNSWKRVRATANTSRLMVGDQGELDMEGMQVNVQVDGFRARVLLDCFYYNEHQQQLEGDFKLRLPDDASLYYFAFGQSSNEFVPQGELSQTEFFEPVDTGLVSTAPDNIAIERKDVWRNVKEARMVPKEKAALAYTQTVRRKVDPALVEWNGAGVFAARVFPLMPQTLHRIVIGYDVSLTKTDDGLSYRLDLPQELGQCKVDLNVTGMPGAEVSMEPAVKPEGDLDQYRFQLTNSKLGKARTVELKVKTEGSILLQSPEEDELSFWSTQVTPDLPEENVAANSHAVFLLDTSLSSNPDKFNVWQKMLRQTLTQNRDSMKRFAVMIFNVESYFWRDGYVENTAANVDQLIADCEQLALEGATDLYGCVDLLASTEWVTANENKPDLFLLSDGAATWGETNLRQVQSRYSQAEVGSLFAYQTGLTGTAISGLRFLADQSGGAVFSVASEAEVDRAATAHRNRPWRIESIQAPGGTDLMTAGRVSWVYPGQTITVVGRGKVDGNLEMNVRQGETVKAVDVEFSNRLKSPLASRMYGFVAVGQLESLGSQLEDVGAAYARHFRVTGQTCSLLMLESEADYQRFNIVPQEDLFVIKTRNANELVEKVVLEKKVELVSPKARLLGWYRKLEKMPGLTFEIPTALNLAMDAIQVEAISKPLICKSRKRTDLQDGFLQLLNSDRLDYGLIVAESKKRGLGSSSDALKVLSSLIEKNPSDLTLARDVAFVAMELDEPAHAFGLLRQVAMARPFEPTIYPALGKCLTQLGRADMAILFYEVAMEAQFQNRTEDFRKIVAAEYMHLLRKVHSGVIESNIKGYASHRLSSLEKSTDFGEKDLVITMMWNTDQSDVDLHVVEPSGEDCFYGHRITKSGGQITRDITDGFGPEMYTLRDAPKGKYSIRVNYFGSNANRTNMRSKVYLAIYENYGHENETVKYKSVELSKTGDLEDVATVGVIGSSDSKGVKE